MPRRLMLPAAIGVGVLFAVGLFTHGPVGGSLLVVTDAILVLLTYRSREDVDQRGVTLRGIVILAIAVLAVVKLAGNA